MPRHTATEARRQLFQLLDSVELGEEVIVERRGVSFRVILGDEQAPPVIAGPSPLRVADPSLLGGDWTWQMAEDGQLTFEPQPSTRDPQ